LFSAKHLFNEVADIAWSDLVNSRTFKDLWNEIQGLSSTCPVFKYFQVEPCADAILSAAARRLILFGGGGARRRADRV